MAFWSIAYQHGWATKAQLAQAVKKGFITADDYKTITGDTYTE